MSNKIKIIELSKKLLPVAYKGKKIYIYYWLKFKGLIAYKELKKNKA